MKLKEKVVVVTGGSKGIGEALVLRYAAEGAHVAILSRNVQEGRKVADVVNTAGGTAIAFQCDIGSAVDRNTAILEIHKSLGRVNVLVNNAGTYKLSPFGLTTEDEFQGMVDVNLKGLFFLSQSLLPDFEAASAGKIINIASIFGNDGFPGSSVYCATKAGVILLTKSLAIELRSRNIQVNAIAPGWVKTPMNAPLRKGDTEFTQRARERFGGGDPWMTPDDIAGSAVFLASKDADSITGTTLFVDRGWSAF
jgi:glucose 1-dehydrogenase